MSKSDREIPTLQVASTAFTPCVPAVLLANLLDSGSPAKRSGENPATTRNSKNFKMLRFAFILIKYLSLKIIGNA
jgi:hypothetical protein